MKTKAVFLDRDGTINVEKHYLYKIEDFEFLPGVLEGLRLLQSSGFLLIIITNQSGIGRGYYTEKDFEILNLWMTNYLRNIGIEIAKVYYCPHLKDAVIEKYKIECKCRKPKLGMFEEAIKYFNIDVNKSWAIGDKLRDCLVCEKLGLRGFLISDNEKEEIIHKVRNHEICRVEYAADLLESAKLIVSNRY